MFLAAISEKLIAPSEIVDIVWHLHLVYSDAYQSFCRVLGKEVLHIPSRKEASAQEQFAAAERLTQSVYTPFFGPMPEAIWEDKSLYDSLHLARASHTPEKVNILAVVLFFLIVAGLCLFVRPVYRNIDSIYFLPAYLVSGIIIILSLFQCNQQFFKRLIGGASSSGFLFQLTGLELIALKSGAINTCIHVLTNELVVREHLAIDHLGRLSAKNAPDKDQIAQLKVYEVLNQAEAAVVYDKVLCKAAFLPYFQAIQSFGEGLRHYLSTSKEYLRMVIWNYSCLGCFLALGLSRIFTGLVDGKPVVYSLFLVLIFTVPAVYLLRQLQSRFLSHILPDYYLKSIPPPVPGSAFQWSYLESGLQAFTTAFMPVAANSMVTVSPHPDAASGSACGTSCGSSCGSACGGCGGD